MPLSKPRKVHEEFMSPEVASGEIDNPAGMSRRIRDFVLAVIVIGTVGLIAELLLQEHTESWQQWIPLVLLGLGLAATALVRMRPSRSTVMVFRLLMAAFLGAGLFGVYLHYAGNVEFAVERKPELTGMKLIWEALRGATPALAPGAMVQLGLLGLVYAYRHPADRSTT
jgi:hypothetical protein